MTYNLTREAQSILEEHQNSPSSFSVQLYHDNWTLNSGPKFLYNSPAYTALFDDIKANRIPVDLLELFDAAKAPFYEGCMIVEIEEFSQLSAKDNSKESKPLEKTVTRVLLRPNSETLFADLCILNQKAGGKWTDKDALEIEAKILLATSPPLCLDPDPRLGKIANSLYRISLPRTPPPLRPKKRKAKSLESNEEDEATWNRKAKIIRFMDPKPTRSATPSYRLLDHIERMKALPVPVPAPAPAPSRSTSPNVYNSNPLHKMPATNEPAQQSTSQPQSQAPPQTTPQPQPQSQPQPKAPPTPQPQPQPQSQPQPQPQPSQPQQPPRSTATPVVTAPSTPGSTETKKSTPKPAARRTQTPGDGTLGTPTPPSATPVHSTPKLTPQHVRPTRPVSRPTSQSPHPAAATANAMASSPRVVPSPALHAVAVSNTAPSNSPRPPPQPIPQPSQGHPQAQLQNQVQQRQFQKGLMTTAQMQMAHYKALAAAQAGQNPKANVIVQPQVPGPPMYYVAQPRPQAQAQTHIQAQAYAQGQGQPTQLRFNAQMANPLAQAHQQQPQQQNGQVHPMSRTTISAAGANGNKQTTSRSPMPIANGQSQPFVAASGQLQQSPQPSQQQQQHQQQQQYLALQQHQYSQHLQQQQQQQQQHHQHHPGQTQDATQQPSQMFMTPQMRVQLLQLQAQAGGRGAGVYNMGMPWQQMGFRNSQPHPIHPGATAAQANAAAQAQPQGAGAR